MFRRLGAVYALGFFVAAAFAPHRHLNSLDDLFLGGRSDSGVFVQGGPMLPSPFAEIGAARLIDDSPCPACFQDDFTASTAPVFILARTLRPLPWTAQALIRAPQEPLAEYPNSRSPPAGA